MKSDKGESASWEKESERGEVESSTQVRLIRLIRLKQLVNWARFLKHGGTHRQRQLAVLFPNVLLCKATCPTASNTKLNLSSLLLSNTRLRSSTRTRLPCWWGRHKAEASSPPSSDGHAPRAKTDPPRVKTFESSQAPAEQRSQVDHHSAR